MNPLLLPYNKLEILNLNRNVILNYEFGMLIYMWEAHCRIKDTVLTDNQCKVVLFFPHIGHSVS